MLRKSLILAVVTAFALACASTNDTAPNQNRKAKRGATLGGIAGAIAGAIIGNQSGNNRTGAVVEAAAGAPIGGAIGRKMDKQAEELKQIEGVAVERHPGRREI